MQAVFKPRYVALALAAASLGFVSYAGPVTIGRSEVNPHISLVVANERGQSGEVALLLKGNSPGLPRQPLAAMVNGEGEVASVIDSNGALYSNQGYLITGDYQAVLDDEGALNITSQGLSPAPGMLAVVSDIEGPTVALKASSEPDAQVLLGLGPDEEYVWSVEADGSVRWGDGPGRDALDVGMSRAPDSDGDGNVVQVTTASGDAIQLRQHAAIADPSGGATVDNEARQALADILARLRNNGMLAQ